MAFRISRRALQLAIAQAIAIAAANLRRATARQQWRDSITGTVTVRIRDAAGTLKATVTRTQVNAGDWATLEADSATFNHAGTTSTVASAGNPPSAAPWWTMHFEDASGEFAVMTVGSRASSGADYKLDPIKVGVPVRLRNLVFATNPALAGSGGGGAAPSASYPALRTADAQITTITYKNVGTQPEVNPPISVGLGVAPSDVPAGSSIQIRANDGTTIYPCQQDQEATWPNGSLRFCSVSFRPSITVAAGTTATFQVWAKIGVAPIRASSFTAAQLAGLCTRKHRHRIGADAFVVDANELLLNAPLADANGLWGDHPTRGQEIVRDGPICHERRVWGYAKRESDAAMHGWIRGIFHVRAWAPVGGGAPTEAEVIGFQRYSNINGRHPAGAQGPTTTTMIVSETDVLDGNALVRAVGGTADVRAQTVQSIDLAANQITLQNSHVLMDGLPVRLVSTGTLPSGVGSGLYFLKHRGGNAFSLHPARSDVPGGSNTVDLTAAGSGTITVVPMTAHYYGSGFATCGQSAQTDWYGRARPTGLAWQAPGYLTTKSRITLPYDLTNVVTNPHSSPAVYGACAKTLNMPWDQGEGSDGGSDDRIGYFSHSEVIASIYQQSDPGWQQNMRAQALQYWNDYGIWYENEKTGRLLNVSEFSYPRMGENRTGFRAFYTQNLELGDAHRPGYALRYGVKIEGSHLPRLASMAYIHTGDAWFREIAEGVVITLYASSRREWDGKHYYCVAYDQQPRGHAWGEAAMQIMAMVGPDSGPYTAMMRNEIKRHFEFMQFYWGGQRHDMPAGMYKFGVMDYAEGSGRISYMYNFLLQSCGMARWAGAEAADAATAWFGGYLRRSRFDMVDPQKGGCPFDANAYSMFLSGTDDPADPVAHYLWWQYTSGGTAAQHGYTGPLNAFACPTTGMHNGAGWSAPQNSNSALHAMLAGLATNALAGDADAARVYPLVRSRVTSQYGGEPKYAVALPA